MKTKFRKSVWISLAVIVLGILWTARPVYAAQGETVRIGYIDYNGFIMEKDGQYSGYGVEYLQKLSDYTGWKYEYVYGSWSDLMDRVQSGEVDFLMHAQKTPEREENYLFSKYSVGSESSILYTKADDESFYYNDFEAFDGCTIGFMKGSFQNDEFKEYADMSGFSYISKIYENETKCFEALENGEVDAVAIGSLASKSGYKVIARFGSDPFYMIAGKEQKDLVNELNAAQSRLMGEIPTFLGDLYDKYYGNSSATSSLLFTHEEVDYIESMDTITVGQIRNRFPISSLDEKTGTLSGISEDILNKISEMSGLKFVSEPISLDTKPIDALKSGEFDMVMGILNMDSFRQDDELSVSEPYISSTLAVVLRKGEEFNPANSYRVALKTSFQAMQEYIAANYPQFNMTFYSTDEECLGAVQNGEADVMMQNVYVMNYWLQKPKYESLQILPTTFFTEENCMAARSTADPRLMSIINKCIACLTDEEINDIVMTNTAAKPYEMTIADFLYKYRGPFAVVFFLLLVCFVLLGWILTIRQRNFVIIEEKNHDLSEAVDAAERANSAKSQFLSRMSHEIRTPMNAIVGLTTIAKSHEQEPKRIDEYLTKIEASSKVLLNIINDVLDMSAIESDKLKIANSEFDIKQVLNGISTIYYSQCRDKGIDFKMGVDVSDEMLIGDSLRVNQILMNLVSNAFKFTDAGGKIEITVKQTNRKGKQVFLRFEVSDTGSGMTPQMLERLFKPFEQESAMTAQKHGGSGLGMSIAKNLVDMMQGAISVQSEKGVGTTFTVDLPFETTEHSSMIDPDRLKEMHALIVDDDETARNYTSVIVGRVGIDFDVAASGREAIEMMKKRRAQNKKYDLCFVDWRMPDMNGLELTKEIRETFNEEPVVIIVSAYDLSEVEAEAKEAGADMFISKPLFQSTVFNTLIQITGGVVKNTDSADKNYDFTGHKLLLAEDNELNTEIAIELLGMVNMQVDHAGNGEEAVKMFQEAEPGTYDLILMDIQMPLLDGYGAARAIRDLGYKEAETIPIFAMTANAFTEDVSHSLSAGMNGHISKPIDTAILYSTIQAALAKNEKEK